MATRRARIKAVASLPVRRKNAEAKDLNKNQQEPETQTKILSTEISKETDTKFLDLPQPAVTETSVPSFPVAESLTTQINSPEKTVKKTIPQTPLRVPKKRHRFISESESDINAISAINSENGNLPNVVDGVTKISSKPNESLDISIIDGIVPLQTTPKSKPLHMLKNELISDCAEVAFDPIVPLPSVNKVRQKLKPVPRFNPPRRNSIQGSASESEDESRRSLLGRSQTPKRTRHDSQTSHSTISSIPNRELSRVRADSVCSIVSHATTQNASSSPKPAKSKRPENPRRINAMRRRQEVLEGGSKEGLTMYDLIFYNPTTNPIVDKDDDEEESVISETKAEEVKKKEEKTDSLEVPNEEEDSTPAPQIKIGPDGKIILDEKSLVIEGTESKRGLSQTVVRERNAPRGGRYSRTKRAADWTEQDTIRFYRALAAVGTDFSMMAPLFPGRTRREIKIKFKKEERLNGPQVDKALQSCVPWEITSLENEFREQRIKEAAAKEIHATLRKARAAKLKDTGRTTQSQGGNAVDIFRSRRRPAQKTPQLRDILCNVTDLSTPKSTNNTQIKIISKPTKTPEIANLSKINPHVSNLPSDIEKGSLVVVAVSDPNAPGKKLLQTYISDDTGKLTAINLPNNLLSSVAGYIKKGSPNSISPAAQTTPSSSKQKSLPSTPYHITQL